MQVFLSLPQVYEVEHPDMQGGSNNICVRMGRFQELIEFICGAMIGCNLRNKSRWEISALLNISQSAVKCGVRRGNMLCGCILGVRPDPFNQSRPWPFWFPR
ncbi:hypothetical protein XENOCAPTIV_016095 [Xenoophorus captivus]|uniref:Uncharacterized protein n=1 Tax=Xenoophorus captivus TaxID=1517983 RepID=A0ABV0S529_9TELE